MADLQVEWIDRKEADLVKYITYATRQLLGSHNEHKLQTGICRTVYTCELSISNLAGYNCSADLALHILSGTGCIKSSCPWLPACPPAHLCRALQPLVCVYIQGSSICTPPLSSQTSVPAWVEQRNHPSRTGALMFLHVQQAGSSPMHPIHWDKV